MINEADYIGMSPGKLEIDVILESKGMRAVNRLHAYSFTTNIIRLNAKEIVDAIELTSNPEFMIKAFHQEKREESNQLHREVNRLVHNYLCSVSTFIDHSRNFMNRHYADTKFKRDYEREISSRFSNDPLARFIRDLRNYITHRGLPDSKMLLRMVNDRMPSADDAAPGQGRGSAESAITYGKDAFLSWDGWSGPARKFLKDQEADIPLMQMIPPHAESILGFIYWFVAKFREFHRAELEELSELQALRDRLEQQQLQSAS